MNQVVLIGRLTKDPEVRYTQGEPPKAVANYSIAVNRDYKNAEGNYDADFFNCVCFGKTAEFVEKYLHKGNKIAIAGKLQQDRWTDENGNNHSAVKVVVSAHDFCEKQNDGAGFNPNAGGSVAGGYDGFMNIPEGIEEELPFK